MSTTSRVPAAIDALFEFTKTAVIPLHTADEPEVGVYDGAPTVPVAEIPPDAIVIGGTIGEQLAVTGSREGPGGLASHDTEKFQVSVGISSVRDAGETKKARDRVAAIKALLETKLKADMTLGGVVNRARVGPTFAWDIRQVARGEGIGIEAAERFTIEITALL